MLNKSEYVVVTKKALENKEIGFAYRIPAEGMKDSGWRMMYNKSENKLDLANPDKVFACDIKDLLKYFPEIEEFLKEKKYTYVEYINGIYIKKKTDKNLSDIPFRMSGKQKYNVIIGSGSTGGRGFIFTPDPKNMKHNYNDWEELIP